MSRLIDAEYLLDLIKDIDGERFGYIDAEDINNAPIIDAVPVAWINKHLEWLDNCDNDFAQLAKVSIFGMLELWRKDSVYGDRVTE